MKVWLHLNFLSCFSVPLFARHVHTEGQLHIYSPAHRYCTRNMMRPSSLDTQNTCKSRNALGSKLVTLFFGFSLLTAHLTHRYQMPSSSNPNPLFKCYMAFLESDHLCALRPPSFFFLCSVRCCEEKTTRKKKAVRIV